jgi:uncharacterized membrane protein
MLIWIAAIVVVFVILVLFVWASGDREANDMEVSSHWGRGPADGGGGGVGGF